MDLQVLLVSILGFCAPFGITAQDKAMDVGICHEYNLTELNANLRMSRDPAQRNTKAIEYDYHSRWLVFVWKPRGEALEDSTCF